MRKKLLFFIFKLITALVTMLILVKTVNFQEIGKAFRNPYNPVFIYLSLFLLIPNLFLQWYRWHYLIKLIHNKISIKESISSFFCGMVIGFVTPGRFGELGRPLFLDNVDKIQAIGLVLIDKMFSFITILTGGSWGIIALLSYLFNYASYIVLPLLAVALLISFICIMIMIHPQWLRNTLYNLSVIFPSRDRLKRLIHCLDHFQTQNAKIFMFMSIVLYIIYIIQFCFLSFAFQKIPLTTALTATTSTIFAKTLLPISLADLGIREGASVYFFLKFNVDKVTAFNSSLLLFVINILIPTFIGLLYFIKFNSTVNNDSK
jgi:uncharacterized protein (TIRG00374 family)